jgi:uncharacterized protein (DUF433 family)
MIHDRIDPMSTAEIKHIESTPGTCGGKPRIAGSRIRVQDIYIWHELVGRSAEEIVASFPQITLADVYAALTYYWDHRDQIQEQMNEEEELLEAVRQRLPSKLQQKLRPNSDGDPLPS